MNGRPRADNFRAEYSIHTTTDGKQEGNEQGIQRKHISK